MEKLPESLHFVGAGGIGMSGLAQMAAALGRHVSGSDRALNSPENARIIDSLRKQNIILYAQDGSRYQDAPPDALVYSTAIEEDNPDFKCAPTGTPRLHRSEALALCADALGTQSKLFAVSGTCGKTTVSAWLAEALRNIGAEPGVLCGGLVNAFADDIFCGNFFPGKGTDFVIEADESDKSLLNYRADRSLILNIGTDHYSREELARVFRDFILNTRDFSILGDDAFREIGPESLKNADITLFSRNFNAEKNIEGRNCFSLNSYRIENNRAKTSFDGMREISLSAPGIHNAENALAVYVSLLKLGYSAKDALEATESFRGVWRRFDFAGKTSSGVSVYDDYAHNVEKIVSCLKAAQETSGGRIFIFFQPHGFAPLKFMREELFASLEKNLCSNDVFAFLPVYYAGGSSSFKPTSTEVAESYKNQTKNLERYQVFESRKDAEKFLYSEGKNGDIALVMGARDASLSLWAKEIVKNS